MATAPSLFGATPEEIRQQQATALDAQAMAYSKLDPFQRATYGIYKGANQLAGSVGGMLGGTDPQMAEASQVQQIVSRHNTSTPEGLQSLARELAGAGHSRYALQASQAAQAQQLQTAQTGLVEANLQKTILSNDQEAALRAELGKLGASPTEAEVLGVVSKYGPPANILQALSATAGRREAAAARVEAATVSNDARVEAARIRGEERMAAAAQAGADRVQLDRIAADNRTQLVQLTSALKGEKPLTEYQGKALTFGTRSADAHNILNDLEGKYSELAVSTLPSFMLSTEGQRVDQAQRNFVNAVLRQESGAAIASTEFDNAKKQYFPVFGNSPEVIAQKKANRERVIKGFERQAGPGGKDVKEAFDTPAPTLSPRASAGTVTGWGKATAQ